MATSGTMTTSRDKIVYSITITQNSQDVVKNTSNVTVSVKFWRTNTGYTSYGTGTVYCKINGTTYSASVTPTQKITSSGIVLFTKTLNISHDSSGAKKLTCSAWINHDVVTSNEQSYSQTLTTIPRKSSIDSLTCSTNYLDGTLTYKYTPQSSVLYNRLRVSIPNVVKLTTVNLGAKAASQQTATFSFSLAMREDIYRRYPNTDNCLIGFVIETYSDSSYSTKIGESEEKTISLTFPLTMVPTIGGISWTKTSNEPSTWPMTQNISKGTMAMTGVSGIYGSTISTYSLTFSGLSSAASSLTVGNIASFGTLKAIAKVTDSRGRSATKEASFIVMAYSKPKLSISVYRCDSNGVEDDYGDYMYVKALAAITSIADDEDNALQSLTLRYKKHADTSYTSVALTNNAARIFAASSDYTWDWIITATDKVNSTATSGSIPTGEVVLDILADGTGIGLGKVAEVPNMVAINSEWALGFGNVPVVDHIISQGTSGYWYYRKWLSGRAEAWITSEISFTATPAAILGGYYTSGQIDLPTGVFSKPPNCIAGGRTGTGLGFATISSVSTTMVSLGIFGNQNSTASYITSIYAMGRWK